MPKRVDLNHASIRDGLRQCGFYVWDCHEYGKGFPDLMAVCRHTRKIVLLEVKRPGCKLNQVEQEFHQAFPGPCHIVTSLEDAINTMDYYDLTD